MCSDPGVCTHEAPSVTMKSKENSIILNTNFASPIRGGSCPGCREIHTEGTDWPREDEACVAALQQWPPSSPPCQVPPIKALRCPRAPLDSHRRSSVCLGLGREVEG
ncbi:hypothetical protein OPV22_025161 [Ensete ventricosum]|uniref:Uncharacterized protein n=1 Tax=Ensete ventricosum TaxID=4639 RepID=A0AAV8QBX1_ENSVE|nr:hypothetical protein OPV22_025161 [Ensete ventricosum]